MAGSKKTKPKKTTTPKTKAVKKPVAGEAQTLDALSESRVAIRKNTHRRSDSMDKCPPLDQLLLDRQTMTLVEMAKKYGITKQTLSKYLARVQGDVAATLVFDPEVVAREGKKAVAEAAYMANRRARAEAALDRKFDALDQLKKINDRANQLLDVLSGGEAGVEERIVERVSQQIAQLIREQAAPSDIIRAVVGQVREDNQLMLRCCAEIREQLKYHLDVLNSFYGPRAVERFQETVLDAINNVAPDVHDAIVTELVRVHALGRAAFALPSPSRRPRNTEM